MNLPKAALISVYDKTGILEFAQKLQALGYIILSSSGSAKFLQEAGVTVKLVEDYTGQPEILEGRVKTLHPKVHAGILAKRNPQHLADLASIDGYQIDIVAVNLYPFIQNLNSEKAEDYQKMVELIDVGGPTMIRAAAKNFANVYAVIDPSDYVSVIASLESKDDSKAFRQNLAIKVFTQVANYDLAISKYFSGLDVSDSTFSPVNGFVLEANQTLRYGENPHQQAIYYQAVGSKNSAWKQLAGKELSYNNFLDFDAALSALTAVQTNQHLAVIIKHLNPCGAALAESQVKALEQAKLSDPRSHFGGIIAFNQKLELATAENIIGDFCEIVIAPDFDPAALEVLSARKNIRLIQADRSQWPSTEWRSCAGGFLLQTVDVKVSSVQEAALKTTRKCSAQELLELDFAWQICKSVKSNAIVIVKDQLLLATGAGQMSRIDSVELALQKSRIHQHDLQGAVAASDAFFPFADSVETLAAAGVKAIIVTGGAKQDAEVIATAEKLGISLLFTADRHFRH